LANAGGVAVSYLEWEQNQKGVHWSEAEVLGRLETTMLEAAKAVRDLAELHSCGLRQAAYILALERLEAAIKAKGWVS
jgi:glutamate dehydrogenase